MTERPRTPVTRFGLQIPSFTYRGLPDTELFERTAELAVAAEESGFDSLWVMDHLYQIRGVGEEHEPMLECYTLLGALAARTRRVRLGALVTGVTYRNPALLAKIVTTLDVVSAGRAVCGIGAAWNDSEHRGFGFDFPATPERFDRLEEAVQICRAMFTEERPTFRGRHYRVEDVLNVPRPVTPGGPPILIGGSGERRTLRLVAQYADACNLFGDAGTVAHKLEVLRRHCQEVGRDPAEITTTRLGTLVIAPSQSAAEQVAEQAAAARGMTPEQLRAFAVVGDPERAAEQVAELLDVGLDGLIFNLPRTQDPDTVRLAGQVMAAADRSSGG